jgi:hypothetical protein
MISYLRFIYSNKLKHPVLLLTITTYYYFTLKIFISTRWLRSRP